MSGALKHTVLNQSGLTKKVAPGSVGDFENFNKYLEPVFQTPLFDCLPLLNDSSHRASKQLPRACGGRATLALSIAPVLEGVDLPENWVLWRPPLICSISPLLQNWSQAPISAPRHATTACRVGRGFLCTALAVPQATSLHHTVRLTSGIPLQKKLLKL